MESNEMERLLRSLARVQEQPRPQTEKESPKKNLCSSLGYFGARTRIVRRKKPSDSGLKSENSSNHKLQL